MTISKYSKSATAEERFLANIEPLVGDPGCVVWMGTILSEGYGRLSVNGKHVKAHRYAWERVNGPIPDGLFIDHTCHVRSCVNVDHLRLVTPAQNARNKSGARRGRKYDLPRGVNRNSTGKGYSAVATLDGKQHRFGTFPTPELASAAAQNGRMVLFGEYAGNA